MLEFLLCVPNWLNRTSWNLICRLFLLCVLIIILFALSRSFLRCPLWATVYFLWYRSLKLTHSVIYIKEKITQFAKFLPFVHEPVNKSVNDISYFGSLHRHLNSSWIFHRLLPLLQDYFTKYTILKVHIRHIFFWDHKCAIQRGFEQGITKL